MKKYSFLVLGGISTLFFLFMVGQGAGNLSPFEWGLRLVPIFLLWTVWSLWRVSKVLSETKDKQAKLFTILTSAHTPESIQATQFIDEILDKEVSKLTAVSREVSTNLETISSRAQSQVEAVRDMTQQMGEFSTLLSTRLHETMVNLTQQLTSLREASSILKESTLDRETKEIVLTAQRTVNEISQTNSALQETMEMATKKGFELVGTLSDITDKSDDAVARFTKSTNEMRNQAHELVAESKGLDKLIIEENELLEEKVVKTREYAGQFKEIIDDQIVLISNVSDKVGMQIRLSEASIEKQSTILLTTVERLMKQVESVEMQVGQASHALLKISSQLGQELEGLGASVATHLTRVSETAVTTMKRAESEGQSMTETLQKNIETFHQSLMAMDGARNNLIPFIELFEKKVSLLPQISDETQRRILEIGRNLDKITSTIAQSYERIAQTSAKAETQVNRIEHLSEDSLKDLISQTELLVKLSDTARESFGVLTSSLADSMQTFAEKGSGVEQTLKNLNQSVNSQMDLLETKVKKTVDVVQSSSMISDKQSVESFMSNATSLIEKLNARSIDMTRLFAPKVADELWARYQKGERDVFARYLGKNLTPAHLTTLRRLINTNSDFSKQVEGFIEGFDDLMEAARKSVHRDLIISTFTQNPLGHIYMLLKQIA